MPITRSLEAAMDEERREVLNLLEGRPAGFGSPDPVPEPIRTASPAPPVRSMLDIGPTTARQPSSTGVKNGNSSPALRSAPLMGSMLDPYGSPPPARLKNNDANSPHSMSSSQSPSGSHRRAPSDTSSKGRESRPRAGSDQAKSSLPYSDDQFDMSKTVSGQVLPKRVTQGGKRNVSSMASIMQGQELDPVLRSKDRGRHNSTAGITGGARSSKSPSSRLSQRSQSPTGSMLNTNSLNLMPTPGKFVSETGKVIDLNNAYRKLSDANFLKSGSSLSSLPPSDDASRARVSSGTVLSSSGGLRLKKDYYDEDEHEGAVQSSDEGGMTSGEEVWGPRGRKRGRSKGLPTDKAKTDNEAEEIVLPPSLGSAGTPRAARSLLAAAEEERVSVSSQQAVKSMLEPTVMVTSPAGEKLSKKTGVHPSTNYDTQASGQPSPNTSDSEDLSDIRRAQRLAINLSRVDTTVRHRAIRTIIRGEFSKMQREAEEGSRRLRTYLVATDLSAEAAYALEWTIGTVLRDGDTLLAVYAVDEETGTGKTGENEAPTGLPIGEGGAAMQETQAAIGKLTEATKDAAPLQLHSPLSGLSLEARGSNSHSKSRGSSSDSRSLLSKAEQERLHAIEDISQTCIKFLRKTKLQVRIAVEVIHCKSPKYMITEAIDMLEPTLVVLGSRGRSALKGVLLGSFSNYLVTKSSVPVMVARKKLQKPNSKNRLPQIRLANNLTPSKSLAEAKID